MHINKVVEISSLLVGFMIGILFYHCFVSIQLKIRQSLHQRVIKYDTKLADELEKKVKIFCWLLTHPANHKTKVPHILATWGRRCKKLIIFSTESDSKYPEIIKLPNKDGRDHLWFKTKFAMNYVYENHINDADWFVRADDDNYFVIENLRHKLSQYHSKMSLMIGCRFAVDGEEVSDGYIAGGGHVFSKKALTKFVTRLENNGETCPQKDDHAEDVYLGICMRNHTIFVDGRDEKNQKQFFPSGVYIHLMKKKFDPENYWYWKYLWQSVPQGSFDCCSEFFISSHGLKPKELHELECLIYDVYPFGLERTQVDELPKKLTMKEILAASDAPGDSVYYEPHKIIHNFDSDERF